MKAVSTLLENLNTLNCIYFAMVMAGLIFALGSLFLSEVGDGDSGADGGADADGDGGLFGDSDLRIFSPITIGTFMTVFGATGLICTIGLGAERRLSLMVAALAGAAISLLVAFIYSRLLVEMHGSTEIRQADMVGVEALVTTSIPAQGLGEVRFEISKEWIARPARSADNTPIARGSTVIVEQTAGAGVVIVRLRQPPV